MDTAPSGGGSSRRRSTASSVAGSVAASAQEGRPRRVRPSRARGLRTSTGCLTCRRRRIKCDEGKPKCAQCCKSDRECEYAQAAPGEQAPGRRYRSDSTVSNVDADGDRDLQDVQNEALPTITAAGEAEGSNSGVIASTAPEDATTAARPTDFATPFIPSFEPTDPCRPLGVVDDALQPSVADADLGFSPLALSQTSLLNISPFEWYDLLAQDAINNIQRLNSLPNGDVRWVFDETTLSRRQTPIPELPREDAEQRTLFDEDAPTTPPWNTSSNIELSGTDLIYFRYYVEVVGPILDLFDPERHFTDFVPHLAVRNIGLLKSILAVAARHKSLGPHQDSSNPAPAASNPPSPETRCQRGTGVVPDQDPTRMATQYYYETLQYLSHTLLYPSYANSHEILGTAIMISTYEMFDSNGPSNNGDWERHLRGAFWIQRSQDNNEESTDGFRRAVWWAWIRQDIWAAFRSGRRTLTIFQPQRTIRDLNPDELANRVVFIAAKCVAYAAHDAALSMQQDLTQRMNHGNRLLRSLEEWREALPASFAPISGSPGQGASSGGTSRPSSSSPSVMVHNTNGDASTTPGKEAAEQSMFQPIWVHPHRHAGAVQMYHFARAVVLLAQPSTGGLNAYRRRQKLLNESLHMVCGIANASRETDVAMGFLNVQVVFAVIVNVILIHVLLVGQCAQDVRKQAELLSILKRSVDISRFPSKGLTEELGRIWREGF
ncbi:hypothetical protein CPLU01_09069 [Colletotrichum plurivorum]|uniref:Zn(2)-C6 fungal-type domain-containing protein n=1 Tax=Colletotrichum plurivorum TaxID=2175906 RepID=A0A8H6NCG1_9PEZI|nr:hypothetical protein CPLU01_09069 [Colletotrichum plurivorum]